MSRGDVSLACARALVEELVRGGVSDACVSPGSRSTALALALARHPHVQVHVHLDERSSGFFALGMAKALGAPVAVACTSGTAAVELFPAVVEASQSRVPMILLTADRPARLRGTGANQTIDQFELYASYARAFVEPPLPTSDDDVAGWRRAGVEAVGACTGRPPGPVQVNCAFDEPLVPEGDQAGEDPSSPVAPTGASPSPGPAAVEDDDAGRAASLVSGARGLVVAGSSQGEPPGLLVHLAERLRWPVLAEPTSLARRPGQALAAGQALVSSPWIETHAPDVVLQVGAAPTTRATQRVAAGTPSLIVVDDLQLDPDPERHAALRLRAPADGLVTALEPWPLTPAPTTWLDDWRLADLAARRVLDAGLDGIEATTELQVARDTATAIPGGGSLFVGNSMPVRDLDYAMAPREGLRILGNRGASGIDGLVSTAMGIAASGSGPTVALIGDLSLIHDVGALMWNGERALDLTIVVPNNRGGQIFSVVGQGSLPEAELLFVTPHGLDLAAVCRAASVAHTWVGDVWAFPRALDHALGRRGIDLIEVAVDPDRSIEQRRSIQGAVDSALAELT